MDRRLFDAAQAGDVDYLLNLINNEPLVLRAAALAGSESPLHIACMAGHLSFVKEVLKWRKEFAVELNQDGFSPLHIASALGDTEIARELLKVDRDACLIKGRDARTPLHYAAINGKVNVIKELLSANVDSIADLTARGETALHLAVKNYQVEAFKVLLDHIRQFKKEDALNKKDVQGNTILHLAVLRKQYEVIDLVLNQNFLTEGAVEVNSLSEEGLTPLDVLLMVQTDPSDRDIEEILRHAGAIRSRDLHQGAVNQNQVVTTDNSLLSGQVVTTDNSLPSGQSSLVHCLSPYNHVHNYFKYNKNRESPSKIRNYLLVIAVLITTGTYQAVLSPPGGVWQDDLPNNSTNTNTTTPHIAGQAVMGTHRPVSYGLFLVFNSIGFFMSVYMIYFLTTGFPLQLELQVSVLALVTTYDISMTAISPGGTSLVFTILSISLPLVIPIASKLIRDHLRIPKYVLPRKNQATQNFEGSKTGHF